MPTDPSTAATDQLVAENARYAADFDDAGLPAEPSLGVAVVACMDARIEVPAMLGLANGQAHVIRNAGGVVTDDVIRSLCLSQRALGTREIVLVHHTRCGLQGVDEEGFRQELEAETGVRPTWSLESFSSPEDDVRQSIRRVERSPFVPHTEQVRGFVYDVDTGRLAEVGR